MSSVRGVFVNASERRALATGDVLFTAGDSGTEMFGVISGAIDLSPGITWSRRSGRTARSARCR